MSKNLYYRLVDLTRECKDPNSASFGVHRCLTDLAGLVLDFAEHNKVDARQVRLFVSETKADWQQQFDWWRGQVDWTIPII